MSEQRGPQKPVSEDGEKDVQQVDDVESTLPNHETGTHELPSLDSPNQPTLLKSFLLVALLVFLVVSNVLRFWHIENDPPFGIVTRSGSILTDEGWYLKASANQAKFGFRAGEYDLVWFSHNAVFSLVNYAAFTAFSPSLATARILSASMGIICLMFFYNICRRVTGQLLSLAACCAVSGSISLFAFSRIALVEPIGTTFLLGSMFFWIFFGRRKWGVLVALLFVVLAYLTKASFVWGFPLLGILLLGEAFLAYKEKNLRFALFVLSSFALAVVGTMWLQQYLIDHSGFSGKLFQEWHVAGRKTQLARSNLLLNEIGMVARSFYVNQYPVFFLTGLYASFLLVRNGRAREFLKCDRATYAMVLFALGGHSFFGMFPEQPPRYFFFAGFPLVYLALVLTRSLLTPRLHLRAFFFLFVLQISLQVPLYYEWMVRDPGLQAYEVHQEVAKRVLQLDSRRPCPLIGGISSTVGLLNEDILPLDYQRAFLNERLEHHHPMFIFDLQTKVEQLPSNELVESVRILGVYDIMRNYVHRQPHVLAQIIYKNP